MTRQVLLLRGVNVGGHRSLPMATLRSGLEAAGCSDVVTYIQSGNAVITPPSRVPKDLQGWLEGVVASAAGFAVPLVLRSLRDLEDAIGHNPYPDVSGTNLHVVFFPFAPPADVFDGIERASFLPEQATLQGRELYLLLPNGIGRAKLPLALERTGRAAKPPVVGTARNWNTVLKLAALARG